MKANYNETLWGTYHYCGYESINRLEYARKILTIAVQENKLRSMPVLKGIPTSLYPTLAKRPTFSVLDCSKIKNLDVNPCDWNRAGLVDDYEASGCGMQSTCSSTEMPVWNNFSAQDECVPNDYANECFNQAGWIEFDEYGKLRRFRHQADKFTTGPIGSLTFVNDGDGSYFWLPNLNLCLRRSSESGIPVHLPLATNA